MSEKPVASIKTLARYEPDTVYIGTGEYVAECVRADDGDYYLAADVDAAIEALQAEVERLRKLCQDGYRRGYQAGSKGLREMYDAIQEVKRQDAWGNARLTEALMAAEERAERAEAENKRLRKDAARYRWLRARWGRVTDTYKGDSGHITWIDVEPDGEGWDTDPDSLDAAIDAAIQRESGRRP